MPLYEITPNAFRPLGRASFADIKVRERDDLQRLLRTQIEVLGDDLYVLTEEFGDWDDSRRRIDLLAIDKQANLVVVELKRTNDGGHMELQANRGDSDENKRIFDQLHAEKETIEKAFGGPLTWERLDTKRACRIKHVIERGGYRSPESLWPQIQSEMVEAMSRLEMALRPGLDSLAS